MANGLHAKISQGVRYLQHFVDRVWYPLLLAFLAAIDNLIVIVPTDGILVSSSMLRPKRWATWATAISVGSTVGALILAALVEVHGLPWILNYFPGINTTETWLLTEKFFDRYGMFLVFAVAATPLMQQPTVILASLAETPLMELAAVVFAGRFLKFLFMAYLGSHAPRLLARVWGLRSELKEVGIEIEKPRLKLH